MKFNPACSGRITSHPFIGKLLSGRRLKEPTIMEFFVAMTHFIYLFSSEEACDFERVFSGFLAQLAMGGCHWLFIAFNGSCRYLDPRGGKIWLFEHEKHIGFIDYKN